MAEADKTSTQEAVPAPAAKREGVPFEIAVLPLQNTTLFPETMVPLAVGRPASIAAVEAALSSEEKLLACISVRPDKTSDGDADPEHLFEIGTLVMIKRMERVEDTLHLIVQGSDRIRVLEWTQREPMLRARVQILPELEIRNKEEVEAAKRNVQQLIQQALAYLPQVPPEVRMVVLSADDPVRLAYFLGSILNLGVDKEQQMLEADTVDELMHLAHDFLAHEVEIIRLRSKIANEAQTEMDKAQRDYVLRQQMKAIQKELGDDESGEQAVATQLRERLAKTDLPDDVRKEAERELSRMEKLPSMAPDYHVIRTYLDFILELPWKKSSEDRLDLNEARKVLDEDHFGLDDVKERILEFLAVTKLRPDSKSPILCFVGAPGVGKTSLGRSISRAMKRHFERLSLGGVRDEAELRGHRRTYVGAMPGRIIQSIRRSAVNNPVMMLDEIDKLGADYRGDPAAALLEILDPEQNNTFTDHYLDLPFDLSRVFFIATANQLGPIPPALRDRMEVIQLAGYSDREKLQIARRYLVTRQVRENGLTPEQLGEVMQESARAARSYLWAHAQEFGIDPAMFKDYGVHLHVPAGAIPKDGPSAGVTITSALASLFTGRRVRPDTAMTGEITLSGLVFPVGGIKEKVLAAHRAGIHRIILPARNEADLKDIPEDVRRELEIVPVTRINEVVAAALEKLVLNPPPPLPDAARDRPHESTSESLIAKER